LSLFPYGIPSGDPPTLTVQKPYPGFWGAVLLVVLVQILANVVGGVAILLSLMLRGEPVDPMNMPDVNPALIGIFANSMAFAPVIYLAWRRSGRPAGKVFPLRGVSFKAWFPMAFTMAGGLLVVNEITNLLVEYLPPPEWVKDIFESFLGKGTGLAGFVFLVIVAPITEELFFRGVMLQGFAPRYGRIKAVVLSAALFGAIHVIPWQVVPAFLLGLLFGWWTVATGSLWPALTAHAFTNAFAFQQGLTQDPEEIFVPTPQEPWLTALGVALLVIGAWWGTRVMSRPDERDMTHLPGGGSGVLEDQQ
jgi:uncharacterized protein